MAGEINEGIVEKQVYEDVLKEVKTLGNNINKQTDELNRSYKQMKDQIESDKGVITDKISKLQEDIITRQEALDKKHIENVKRLDDIEILGKRPITGNIEKDSKEFKEMIQHLIACKTVTGNGKGMSFDEVELIKPEDIKKEDYDQYLKSFNTFLRKDKELLDQIHFKTLSVGVDPHGGYTVTPFMATQILQRMYESTPMRQICQSMTISTDAVEWMVDRGQAGVGWEGETVTGNETATPDLGRKRIPVNGMYARPRATQQLLEDSAINIEGWLANKIAERFGRFEATAFVTGDGINKPRGFLTYTNGTAWGTVEWVNLGAAAALTADGFIDMKYHLREEFQAGSIWLMNRLTVRDTMMLKDGEGNYIWKPSLIAGDPSSSLLGLPLRWAADMPVVAANALSVALGDFNQGYMIVDRLGITIQRDPYTVKPFVEFYTRKRVGGDVINYDAIKIGRIHV